MSTEELRGRAKSYNESVNACYCHLEHSKKNPHEICYNCTALTALLKQVIFEALAKQSGSVKP